MTTRLIDSERNKEKRWGKEGKMRPRSDGNENNNEVTEEKIEGRGKKKRKSHLRLIELDF